MNFKDAYKNMNDEIHGDRTLLHSILNGEANKTKKITFNFRPVFATALTAVFVLCIATVYKNTGIEQYSPSNNTLQADMTTEKVYEETIMSEEKDVKAKEATVQLPVLDNSQNNTVQEEVQKKSQINNQKTERLEDSVEGQTDYDEPVEVDEGSLPLSASLSKYMTAETEAAYAGDESEVAEYDDFYAEDNNSEPSVAKSFDMSAEVYEENAPESKYASSGGGDFSNSVNFESVVLKAAIPGDMSFGNGVRTGDDSISYVAVSKDTPGRQVTVVVSITDILKVMYPGANHIQTKNGNIAVIAENLTSEEINKIITSLSD